MHWLTRLWGQAADLLGMSRAPFDCHESFEGMSDEAWGYEAIIVPSGMVSDRLRYREDLKKLAPATGS